MLITRMQLEHRLSALLQLRFHHRLLQWIGQRQLQDETRNIQVLGLGAAYIRGLTMDLHCELTSQTRTDPKFAPSQRETALLCNDVSHWLGASLESAMQVVLCSALCCVQYCVILDRVITRPLSIPDKETDTSSLHCYAPQSVINERICWRPLIQMWNADQAAQICQWRYYLPYCMFNNFFCMNKYSTPW